MANKIITDLIEELLTHKNCVFRGENKRHDKVASKLYLKYFEDESDATSENFSILAPEKNIVAQNKTHISSSASNIEVLTELQHYGGKTALIDFTYNVLVALFFACDGEFKKNGRIIIFDKAKVTLKTDIDYDNPLPCSLIEPTGKSPRVIFQSSVFVHTQQGYLNEKYYKIITVKKAQKKDLLGYLQKYFNIETKTIYNDLHGFIQNQDSYFMPVKEFYLGMACQNNGNCDKAIKHYNQAIEINPQYAEAYNNRGIAKFDSGDKEGAIADYDKAIEINPKNAEAYNNRGNAKSDLGNNQEAIADYDKAIKINPQNAEAYNNRGNAKSDLGNNQEAIADYDKAIEINPLYAEAYYNRGIAKSALGDKKGAMADYDKAIEINPQFAGAYTNRGSAKFALGDKEGAIADCNKAIEINPQIAEAYYNLGNAKSASGDKEGAIADYDKAIEINPQYAKAYTNRGNEKFALGDKEGAVADCKQAIMLFKQQGKIEYAAKAEQLLQKIQQ